MNKVLGYITTNFVNENFGKLAELRPVGTIPFGGRYRLVDFPLSNMVHSGIRTVGVTTAYYYRSIVDHLGSGKEWSLDRKEGGLFLLPGSVYGMKRFEGKFLLRDFIQNRPYLDRAKEDTVIVSASNKIFNIDFEPIVERHRSSGAQVTMLYKEIPDAHMKRGPFLELDQNGALIGTVREMAGNAAWFMDCFIINIRDLLALMDWYEAMDYVDMIELLSENASNMKILSYPFDGYVGAVDSSYDYMRCSMELLKPEIREELFGNKKKIFTKVQDAPPSKYLKGCHIFNSLVSSGCMIEGTVENSILFRNVKIGKGAVVKNSIIMQRGTIAPGAVLENVICDKFARISEGSHLSGSRYMPLVIGKNQRV
ncbi:glucose-1-phosphate adenylyltransferase subunit GlgD [bacterium 210820-DFI.6.37]|nr:glucose-1-phosphate adenylyltransferase subunit GlgD [bacterium 210820-DFI.6.37]